MLVDDRRLWHEGSGGHVRVVIFLKLNEPDAEKKIRATLAISHCAPGAGAAAPTTQIVYLPFTISRSPTVFY